MRKTIGYLLLIFLPVLPVNAQQKLIDSLSRNAPVNNDTLQLVWSYLLSKAYDNINADSNLIYAKSYISICNKLGFELQEAEALRHASIGVTAAESIDLLSKAQSIVDHGRDTKMLPPRYLHMLSIPVSVYRGDKFKKYITARINNAFARLYWLNNQNSEALPYVEKALLTADSLNTPDLTIVSLFRKAVIIFDAEPDTAVHYLQRAYQLSLDSGFKDYIGDITSYMTFYYEKKKDFKTQLFFKRAALRYSLENGYPSNIGYAFLGLAEFYHRDVLVKDSAIYYGKKARAVVEPIDNPGVKFWINKLFYEIYKSEASADSALKYMEQMLENKEKVSSDASRKKFMEANYNMQREKALLKEANDSYRNKIKTYSLLGVLAIFLLLSLFLWYNSRKRKRNFLLMREQKLKTEEALNELTQTQRQLIQSEKMASLGELTAGIAHEIQNPLNFVNNFSDVSSDLVAEMLEEAEKGNMDEVISIAGDVKINLEKINHHGKRADNIVKGMLQHSRGSSGQKEITDINALCDEYIKLCYHGLRAKDSSFSASIKTNFDTSLPKINMVRQDIGRVILNLLTNAFYAVTEKNGQQSEGYTPSVCILTMKKGDKIEVTVSDNGNGIPQEIIDKIFQPFFTTKPTGQGTGLGLSLSYDIVKSHDGEIKIETAINKGTQFTIKLPIA